jgi:hypothetical protein
VIVTLKRYTRHSHFDGVCNKNTGDSGAVRRNRYNREEVRGDWKILYNCEPHTLYYSNIIRMIK